MPKSCLLFKFQPFAEFEAESFQQTLHQFRDNYEGAYSNPLINWLLLIAYILGLICCMGLLLVSWFEKTGQAGPYRTLANQLFSTVLDLVVLLFVFGTFLQAIRPIYGPMPHVACKLVIGTFQVFIPICICWIGLSVTGARFVFSYLYGSIPVMDDDFWVRFITRVTMIWSAVATMAKFYTEDRPMITERICTGTWSDKDLTLKSNPTAAAVVVITVALYVFMTLVIQFRKPVEEPRNNYQTASYNLASTLANAVTNGIFFLLAIDYAILSKIGTPEILSEFPKAWYIHFFHFGQFILVFALCVSQYVKSPQLRKSVKRLFVPDRIIPIATSEPPLEPNTVQSHNVMIDCNI